jgi:flavodoxin
MKKLILSILICFILLVPTKSYSITGNKWLELCQTNEEWAFTSCSVYLVGLKDMEYYKNIMSNNILNHMKERGILNERIVYAITEISKSLDLCIPEGVTPEQIKKVLINWLEKNPGELHEQLAGSFISSMQETFPCKN